MLEFKSIPAEFFMIYNHLEAKSLKKFSKILPDLIDTWEDRSIWPLFQPLDKVIHQLLSMQYHVEQLLFESQDPMATMKPCYSGHFRVKSIALFNDNLQKRFETNLSGDSV